ncbi:MAG: hypothetical protein AB8B72_11625 [Crocinitomicaceae bacterium]
MKLCLFCTLFFFTFSIGLLGQNAPESPQRLKLVKVEVKSLDEQRASLELNIQQIESKILFIKNNPVLLREAENAGYLKELSKLKKASEDKLKLLLK